VGLLVVRYGFLQYLGLLSSLYLVVKWLLNLEGDVDVALEVALMRAKWCRVRVPAQVRVVLEGGVVHDRVCESDFELEVEVELELELASEPAPALESQHPMAKAVGDDSNMDPLMSWPFHLHHHAMAAMAVPTILPFCHHHHQHHPAHSH